MDRNSFKRAVREVLLSQNLDDAINSVCQFPARKVINPLFSFLLSTDPLIKWAAVTAFGAVVSHIADEDMESARIIMRRLMWQLNDESGGIGWGCPEAIGEIVSVHAGLDHEYVSVLLSYIDRQGNFLEYEPLQQGSVWAIGRVAQVKPHQVRKALPHLPAFLESKDAAVRGLSCWAMGFIGDISARDRMERLRNDETEIRIFRNREHVVCRVKALAKEAMARITKRTSVAEEARQAQV